MFWKALNVNICMSIKVNLMNYKRKNNHDRQGIGIWEIFMAVYGIAAIFQQIFGGMAELATLEHPPPVMVVFHKVHV